jgi:2-polyprenyl-6-methoxyphenol hydroxylase-like FAD-dependent oxidoreductase
MPARSVLISGAGIAGPALAFWLKAAGFAPTIVERAPALRTGGYIIDVWGLGYEIAKRMGLADDLERAGYHIREVRAVNAEGRPVAGFGRPSMDALVGGGFVTIRRSDLSRLLFERARAEVLFDDEIVALDELSDRVLAHFQHGGKRSFDLIIGADGLHSKVRALVFGREDCFEKRLGYAVVAFEIAGYRPRDEDVYVLYNEPGGMIARVALRDDWTLFLFVLADEKHSMLAASSAEAKAILRRRFGDSRWEAPRILARLDDAPDLYIDAVSQIRLPTWSRGRIALIGDAASCPSLLAGQGAALAMLAAYVLAGELAKADGRHEEAFHSYEASLRGFIDRKQRAAESFAVAFAPKTRWGLFLRNQIFKACAKPPVARFVFGREAADVLPLPDYRWPTLAPPLHDLAGADSAANPRQAQT